jgi:tetratricopeptide (TPR) repeat protein
MTPEQESSLREAYRRHHMNGVALVRSGELHSAQAAFQAAVSVAGRLQDAALQQESRANLAMVSLQLGEDRKAEAGLREILLTSRNPRTLFGAAYNLAVSQRKQGRYDRARFYARRAMESAVKVRDASNRAGCHNLLGNILMNESRFEEALVEYRKSLRIRRRQKGDHRFSIAILLENIGYTCLLKKQFRRGASLIMRALGIASEAGAKRLVAESYQDLCYARMQTGQYDEAAAFGGRALALARECGYADVEKNCYYLLGETAHLAGRTEERDRHFGSLQRMHPELPFLREFLMAFDLSDIITLKR